MELLRRFGVYLGICDEREEDRVYREEAEARSAAIPAWRLLVNAVATLVIGTLVAGLLNCLSTPSP